MGAAGRSIISTVTRLAGAAIAFHRIVKVGAANNKVIQGAAAGDKILGVALPDSKKTSHASNDIISVAVLGVVNIEAGAAVAVGDRLKSDANGKAIPTSLSTDNLIGVALTAAAADTDIIEVVLAPGTA